MGAAGGVSEGSARRDAAVLPGDVHEFLGGISDVAGGCGRRGITHDECRIASVLSAFLIWIILRKLGVGGTNGWVAWFAATLLRYCIR